MAAGFGRKGPVSFRVSGSRKILRELEAAGPKMRDALAASIMVEGYEVWREGARRTPVEGGDLKRSWYVAPPTGRSVEDISVELGVGKKYAIYVHENLMAFHEVGGPQFISSVVNERRRGYVRRVGDRAWDYFRRKLGISAIPKEAPSKPSSESMRA